MHVLKHSCITLILIASSAATAQTTQTTTSKDRQSVNVTVYNSNLALVRETRLLTLPVGASSLCFADVAAQVLPETVHLTSLTTKDSLRILEQNYKYDLLNPAKLLDKYVGRELSLVIPSFGIDKSAVAPVKATLLSNNNGQVWKINDQIVINPYISETRFPVLPDNLVATPTLIWSLENNNAGEQMVEASYLTAGLSWSTDYVLVVSGDEATAGLQGWVTLMNNSGLGFQNARLQLVAGNVNRVSRRDEDKMRPSGTLSNPTTTSFNEEKFFEYHLYTLQHPTSISEHENKQVSLLEAQNLPIRKEFVVNGDRIFYHGYNVLSATVSEAVVVNMEFRNSTENSLGLPLPAGLVRVYKSDANGAQQFIGESRIGHTPKDEDVRLRIGEAFDIVAERKQTDYKRLASNLTEYAYEIKVRNHKDAEVTVTVNEPIDGDWQVLSSSHVFEKTASSVARFRVPVAKDGEATLTYRVRVKY